MNYSNSLQFTPIHSNSLQFVFAYFISHFFKGLNCYHSLDTLYPLKRRRRLSAKPVLTRDQTFATRYSAAGAFRHQQLAPRLPKAQGCDWLAKRGDVLGKHLQARLRGSFQNSSGIRATNQPWVFGATNRFLFIRVNPCHPWLKK